MMTEEEWLGATDPTPMLVFLRWTPVLSLRSRTSDRKTLLFACACCSVIHDIIIDKRSKEALSTAQLFAEGNATRQELDATRDAAWKAKNALFVAKAPVIEISAASAVAYAAAFPASRYAIDAAENAAYATPKVVYDGLTGGFMDAVNAAKQKQVVLLRDIIGNPFQSGTVGPHWLKTSVVNLVQAIYQDRAFDRMPILADALQDAGCENEDILNHCRRPGDHVRGCWVVDLILGKT
jgi:hypothetical protein